MMVARIAMLIVIYLLNGRQVQFGEEEGQDVIFTGNTAQDREIGDETGGLVEGAADRPR